MKDLIFIAGICAMENKKLVYDMAKYLKVVSSKYPIRFIFKASYDKANRTSIDSYRGLGIERGLEILAKIKKDLKLEILTDVHNVSEIKQVVKCADIIQIPAFLCRQTDLIVEISKTMKTINIKKGQFLAPNDIINVIKKVESTGNKNILVTERGTCFGYHNLVVDFRSFLIMKKFGYPVIYDATHSQQQPSAEGVQTGGSKKFTIPMIMGAIATGVDGIFLECHPNPSKAKCDKATVLNISDIDSILHKCTILKRSIK